MTKAFYQVWRLAVLELAVYLRDRLALFWTMLFPVTFLFAGMEWFFPVEARDFVIPFLITISMISAGLFGMGAAVADARSKGVLKTYRASPLHPWQYIAAQIIDRTLTLLSIIILVLLLGRVVYGQSLGGNPAAFVGVILLGTATMLALGFVLLASFKSVESVGGAGFILFGLSFVVMGGMIPLDELPFILPTIARHLPFYPLSQAVITVWMGFPADEIWRHLAIICGWLVGFVLIATRWFRWEI